MNNMAQHLLFQMDASPILSERAMKMLALMGKAASGKDTIKKILEETYGFSSVVTYTTRPMRVNEVPDVTYHFISEDEFLAKLNDGFFAEYEKYFVNGETWYYGSAKEDLEKAGDKTVIILTPNGVESVKRENINIVTIYLYSNLSTIKTRLYARNDKNDAMDERIKRDIQAFKDADLLADRIVYNNVGNDIQTVAKKVYDEYERKLYAKL